jgi:hypothetical protein
MSYSLISEVVNVWKQRGIELRPPATRNAIEITFAELGKPVSSDVIDLYRLADGYERDFYDDNYWYWWPLEYVREMAPYHPPDLICFADWLIDSHYFALKYQDAHTSSVYCYVPQSRDYDPMTWKLAGSLTEFLQDAIHDPERVEIFPLDD